MSVAAMAVLSGLVAGDEEGGDEQGRITLTPVKTKAGTRQSVPRLWPPAEDEGFLQIRVDHERDPMMDLATRRMAMIGTWNVIATDGIISSNRIISQYGLIPPSASRTMGFRGGRIEVRIWRNARIASVFSCVPRLMAVPGSAVFRGCPEKAARLGKISIPDGISGNILSPGKFLSQRKLLKAWIQVDVELVGNRAGVRLA